MKAITIRELHAKTGHWLRSAVSHGEIQVTDNGRVIAKILPANEDDRPPYFSRRIESAQFRRLSSSGRLSRGLDSTTAISEDREDRTL